MNKIRIPYNDNYGMVLLDGFWQPVEVIEDRGLIEVYELYYITDAQYKFARLKQLSGDNKD